MNNNLEEKIFRSLDENNNPINGRYNHWDGSFRWYKDGK